MFAALREVLVSSPWLRIPEYLTAVTLMVPAGMAWDRIPGGPALAPAPIRCPVAVWQGECTRMTAAQLARIREVVEVHVVAKHAKCRRTKETLIAWLAPERQSWVFPSHADDRPETGTYVLGQTGLRLDDRAPLGFGIRAAIMESSTYVLARIAMHEGAHLAGSQEWEAAWVETNCVREGA